MEPESLSPEIASPQSDDSGAREPRISIIVPVLNEGPQLRRFLEHLRERVPPAEIILVNAAGGDPISEPVKSLCDRVIAARRGRARQMNAGAGVTSREIFWFLHADCEVPRNSLEQIVTTLEDPRIAGGCFRIWFPSDKLVYRISDAAGNFAVDVFGRCYGDHGIFCRRDIFEAIGGYPELPLLEDAEFYRLLGKHGRTRQLSTAIRPSTRRYEEIGPYRLSIIYVLLSLLYILHVPIPVLARIYDRLCLCRNEPPRTG
jgi:rSAM/selenodomain-associated transferase 2